MVEIGHVSISGGPGEHGVEQRRLSANVFVEGADTVASQPVGERRQASLQFGQSSVAVIELGVVPRSVDEVGGRDAEEPRQPGSPCRPRIGRRGEAAEEQSPVQRCFAEQHGPGARPHTGDAPVTEHGGRLCGPPLGRHEDPDVRGANPPRSLSRADHRRVEQRPHARRDIGEDDTGCRPRLQPVAGVGDRRVVGHHSELHGRLTHGVVRGRRTRIDPDELDVGVAQLRRVEQQGEGIEQLAVGTVIGPQRRALAAAHGSEVGMDVGAAESVDRLLGITDGDEAMAGEGAVEDLPLEAIGVLELVDEDEPVATGELGGELGPVARIGERRSEVADQAVVADLAAGQLARLHLGHGASDARRPGAGDTAGRTVGRPSCSWVRQHALDGGDEVALDFFWGQRPAGEGDLGTQRSRIERAAFTIRRQGERVDGEAVEQPIAHDLRDQLTVVLDQLGRASRPRA